MVRPCGGLAPPVLGPSNAVECVTSRVLARGSKVTEIRATLGDRTGAMLGTLCGGTKLSGIVKVRLGYSRRGGPLRKEVLVSRSSSLYRRHRFPGEIISYCVWLY